jgi:hypothetical protein
MDQHHGLPAQAAGIGFANTERERSRHGCIDGVSAFLKYFNTGLGGFGVLGSNHAVFGNTDSLGISIEIIGEWHYDFSFVLSKYWVNSSVRCIILMR